MSHLWWLLLPGVVIAIAAGIFVVRVIRTFRSVPPGWIP